MKVRIPVAYRPAAGKSACLSFSTVEIAEVVRDHAPLAVRLGGNQIHEYRLHDDALWEVCPRRTPNSHRETLARGVPLGDEPSRYLDLCDNPFVELRRSIFWLAARTVVDEEVAAADPNFQRELEVCAHHANQLILVDDELWQKSPGPVLSNGENHRPGSVVMYTSQGSFGVPSYLQYAINALPAVERDFSLKLMERHHGRQFTAAGAEPEVFTDLPIGTHLAARAGEAAVLSILWRLRRMPASEISRDLLGAAVELRHAIQGRWPGHAVEPSTYTESDMMEHWRFGDVPDARDLIEPVRRAVDLMAVDAPARFVRRCRIAADHVEHVTGKILASELDLEGLRL